MSSSKHLPKFAKFKIIFLFLALLGFSKIFSQQTNINFSPEGKLENVYDRFGVKLQLKDILIDPPAELLMQKATSLTCSSTSFFNLFFEPGSGMENTAVAEQNARRAVICKVFEDVSNFINSPLALNGNKVNIVVRNFANENAAAGTRAMASSFFIAPSSNNNTAGILDGEVWKTIHLGVDSYSYVSQSTNSFYHGMVAVNFDPSILWHTDLATNAPTNVDDLYSVLLHEVMHALGLHSFINENGGSLTESNYYSRFDTFLKTNDNISLLTIGSCSMFDVSFNAVNVSPYVLRPGCSLPGNINPDNPLNTTLCNNAIKYTGSSLIPVPVYTPTCYEIGSSLSHFEDMLFPNCTSIINDTYFVVSNGVLPGVTKRYLKPEERTALCDIGYSVKTTFGSSTTSNGYYDYGGTTCSGITVAGLDDGIDSSTGTYTFIGSIATIGATSTSVSIQGLLANDTGYTNFECLQDLTAPSTTTITNSSGDSTTVSTFTTTTPGLHLLRYYPLNNTAQPQQRGNITYVWVYVIPPLNPGTCSPTPNLCDLVMNGDFEQYSSLPTSEIQIIKACGWNWPSIVPQFASDYFNSDVVPSDPNTSVDIPCNKFGHQDCKNNIGKGYADIFRSAHLGRKHLLTELKSQLLPNTTYQLSFDVSLQDTKSNFASNIQAYLSTDLLGINTDTNQELNTITNPSLLFSSPIIRNTTGWETVTFNFTTTTGQERFLYLGFLSNSIIVQNTPVIVPTCNFDNTTNNNSNDNSINSQNLGYYIDNVSLIPTNGAVFNLPATACTNQVLSDLTTFLSGVPTNGVFTGTGVVLTNGVYSFNPSIPGISTTTVGYTYSTSVCNFTLYDTITISNANNSIPTFSFVTSLCKNTTAPSLPSLSNNFITGTWSPSMVSNITTGNYVFTPTLGQCANTVTIKVTVNALPVITSVLPATQTVCLNAAPISLHIAATATGITYQWYKNTTNSNTGGTLIAGAIAADYTPPTNAVGTKYYYVIVKNTSNCTLTSAVVTVIVTAGTANAGSLSGVQTLCKIGKPIPTTVFTATVAGGIWTSSNTNIATVTVINTNSVTVKGVGVGTATITYTVAGANGCTKSVTRTVTVLNPTIPTFTQFPINPATGVPDPLVICAGATPPALPTTSSNGITGTWSPSAINPTITGDYIFTPTTSLCAYSLSESVIVNNTTDFIANTDTFFMTQPTALLTTDTVFLNDTYNGNFLTTADVPSYITYGAILVGVIPTISTGGINFNNSTGIFTVLPGTPAGTYTYHYVLQTPCGGTATPTDINIVISSYVSGPVRSEYTFCFNNNSSTESTSSINPTNQHSLYDGAMINGVPASSSNATIVMISPSTLPNEIVINADGTFTVAAGTPPHNYSFLYKLCSGGYCSSPINWNIVIKSPLRLFHDTATYNINGILQGGGSFNVLTNDLRNLCDTTFSGTNIPLDLNSVHVTGSSTTPAYFKILPTGNVSTDPSVNPNGSNVIPIGTYSLSYTVCDATFITICATQTLTITVTNTFKMAANASLAGNTHSTTNTSKNALQIINFPDVNLKAKLLDSATCFNTTDGDFILADSNGDGEIDTNEALQIGRVNLSSASITDLTGLEYFTNLTSITLYQNNVTSFNIALPNLSSLGIPYNPLTNLNTLILPNLSLIGCSNTLLTSLNNNNNPLLNILNIDDTHISSLDLGICHNLTYLYCSNNPNLTTINIKNTSSLDYASSFMQQDCWVNCPNLNNICADADEIPALQAFLAGCGVSTSGININSDCALDTEHFSANTVTLHPNPVTNILNIDFGTPVAETSSYAVYDVLGKKIVEGAIEAGASSITIPFENYPNGVYLLRLNAGDKMISKKIIKE